MKRSGESPRRLHLEPTELGNFWLTEVYFPEIVALDRGRCPSTAEIEHHLGDCRVDRIAIPHDCAMDSSQPSGVDRRRTSIRRYERECLASRFSTQTSLLEGLRSSVRSRIGCVGAALRPHPIARRARCLLSTRGHRLNAPDQIDVHAIRSCQGVSSFEDIQRSSADRGAIESVSRSSAAVNPVSGDVSMRRPVGLDDPKDSQVSCR